MRSMLPAEDGSSEMPRIKRGANLSISSLTVKDGVVERTEIAGGALP